MSKVNEQQGQADDAPQSGYGAQRHAHKDAERHEEKPFHAQ